MFWVGLMDGDGSIQVNHWRKKNLQFRLIIKWKFLESNYRMLILIAQVVGGNVRITKNKENVIWVVDNKEAIISIIKIFEQYPPLTSRKICQLKFLIECLKHNDVDRYLAERDQKYDNLSLILNAPFVVPFYFQAWLAGFVEAEGCFSFGPNSHPSFSVGQNNDLYLLEAIKSELKITTQILLRPKGVFYILTAYRRETLQNIIKYFENYPLLGAKAVSLKEFKKKLEE